MELSISTPYGDNYTIDDNGNIIRNDIQGFTPSGQWKMLGLSHVKRNEFIPLKEINQALLDTLQLRYKNGNPQYTVRDYDHGTIREWGNTVYHGVKYIYEVS